jgi:hypothetical protein
VGPLRLVAQKRPSICNTVHIFLHIITLAQVILVVCVCVCVWGGGGYKFISEDYTSYQNSCNYEITRKMEKCNKKLQNWSKFHILRKWYIKNTCISYSIFYQETVKHLLYATKYFSIPLKSVEFLMLLNHLIYMTFIPLSLAGGI